MSNSFRDPAFAAQTDQSPHMRDGASYLTADRQPCIICGQPNGDCVGDSPRPSKVAFSDEATLPPSLVQSAKILVEEDVFEERQITPFTKITVRLAKKGSYVTIDKARKLGILKD